MKKLNVHLLVATEKKEEINRFLDAKVLITPQTVSQDTIITSYSSLKHCL